MFSHILVGVDGRAGGKDAIALATRISGPDTKLTLANIYASDCRPGKSAALALAAERRESAELLDREQARLPQGAAIASCGDVPVAHGLRQLVRQTEADLLVLGSSRHGTLGHVFMGDDACAALSGAACAVAVAPRGYRDRSHHFGQIGIGFDDSPESQAGLTIARELAEREGATVKALWVVSLEDVRERIPADWPQATSALVQERRERLAELDDVEGIVVSGAPRDELSCFGHELDLLIVGCRGYGPVGRLFHGSVSRYLIRHAPCPLLVLPRTARPAPDAERTAKERSVLV